MPPQLALTLYFCLITYLFRIDSRNRDQVSRIFWYFSIWGMIISSRPIGNWLQISSNNATINPGTESSIYNIIVGLFSFSLAIYVIINRRINITLLINQNRSFLVLIIYCFLSCAWSDEPFVSFRRIMDMIMTITIVIGILSESDQISAIKKFFGRSTIFAVPLSIVLIKYYPDLGTSWNKIGDGMMWTGVCTHKNTLGTVLAAGILFNAWKWLILNDFKTIKSDIFLFVLAAYLMFNPAVKGSSTAQLSLFASLGVLFLLKFYKNSIQRFMIVFYALIVCYFITDFGTQLIFNKNIVQIIALASKRDITFTGRTYIWNEVLAEATQSPIVGTGFGMFWTGERMVRLAANPFVGDYIKQSHNGFIETYANLGIIGLILLIIFLFSSLNYRLKDISNNYQFNSLAIAFILQCILAEFFEATVLSGAVNRWVYLLLFIVRVPKNNTKGSTI